MTKKEILKKVIKRSTENGFETYPSLGVNAWVGPNLMNGSLMEEIDWEYAMENLNNIIFDPKFAKAFWGTKAVNDYGNTDKANPNFPHWRPTWIFHLREMVSEEDRLNYLKKFL